MKLFRHVGAHIGPKSSVRYTVEYLLAASDEAVFAHLEKRYGWEDDYEDYANYRATLLAMRGPIHDDEQDYSDAYYGINLYGWEPGVDIALNDAGALIRLGIAKQL